MNFQGFFTKPSHSLGLVAWCCLHLNCAYPSPIMLGKSQKAWSRWVKHLLNKIFPVLEDKCSSNRSVEQFHPILGLSSHWGRAARCFSAESGWAREPGVVVSGDTRGLLVQATWILPAAILAKTSWGRNSMWDHALIAAVPLAGSRFSAREHFHLEYWRITWLHSRVATGQPGYALAFDAASLFSFIIHTSSNGRG